MRLEGARPWVERAQVKPEAGEGNGSAVSWLTSATLNCVKFDWNALLKCAEWGSCCREHGLAVDDEAGRT